MNSRTSLAFLISGVMLMIGAFSYSAQATVEGQERRLNRWEHLAIPHPSAELDGELSQQLNRLGNEGWQLVTVSSIVEDGTAKSAIYYFKRPK